MTQYYFFDRNGRKQGPVSVETLQKLATQGMITPNTQTETDTGYKGVAGMIPGLFSSVTAVQTAPSPPEPKTNPTGNPFFIPIIMGVILFGIILLSILVASFLFSKPYKTNFENIFEAAQKGDIADVKYFLDQGVDVNSKDGHYKATALHWAASGNHKLAVLKYLIKKGADMHETNEYGWTPLFSAANANENVYILEYLIKTNRDAVNSRASSAFVDDISPLHCAMMNPNTEILKCLIKHRAEVNAIDKEGKTLLDVIESIMEENKDNENAGENMEKTKIDEKIRILRRAGAKHARDLPKPVLPPKRYQ